MVVELIQDKEEFKKLKKIWNDLLSESDIDNPFMTHEWFTLWWQFFGKNFEMLIFLIYEEQELIAIVPLMRSRLKIRGINSSVISFIANYYSNRVGMIIKNNNFDNKSTLAIILKHINENKFNYDLLHLDFVVKNSVTDKNINFLLKQDNLKYKVFLGETSPYIIIDKSWLEYLSKRSKNYRSKVNHTNNQYKRINNFEISEYTNTEIDKAFKELLEISKKTWKFKSKTAIVNDSEKVDFYRFLAIETSKLGWLKISILKIGEKPIAFTYGLNFKQKTYFLKIGFNDDYHKFSPGFFLLNNSIKHAFENGFKEFDLMGQNEKYKLDLTEYHRVHLGYKIYNNTWKGILFCFIDCFVIPFIKTLLLKNKR